MPFGVIPLGDFLLGCPFTLCSDHTPLKHMMILSFV